MSGAIPPFQAFLIRQDENRKVSAAMESMTVDALDAGEVLIRVAYSSVNYKDALAATGAGKIIRRFPCVGGIDMSGTVVESADPRFKAGDEVIATSYDIGVAHHGGYAEYARVPAGWGGAAWVKYTPRVCCVVVSSVPSPGWSGNCACWASVLPWV